MQKITKKDAVVMILAGAITFGFHFAYVVVLYEIATLCGIII